MTEIHPTAVKHLLLHKIQSTDIIIIKDANYAKSLLFMIPNGVQSKKGLN